MVQATWMRRCGIDVDPAEGPATEIRLGSSCILHFGLVLSILPVPSFLLDFHFLICSVLVVMHSDAALNGLLFAREYGMGISRWW